MRMIRSITKYIFIIYLSDVLDADIILYKFSQTYTTLTFDKTKCLIFHGAGVVDKLQIWS